MSSQKKAEQEFYDQERYTKKSCCHITKYALHTQTFSVNNGNIYGFCGNIKVKFSGNDMTRRLMNLIFLYANFAGIGIKTALGMGAVDYQGFANPRRSS